MYPLVVIISLLLTLIGNVSLYKGWYIANVKLLLLIAVFIGILYFYSRSKETSNQKLDMLMKYNLMLYVVLLISSFVYTEWKFENAISSHSVSKLVLILLSLVSLYLGTLFIRAEISYKKKRGNQRIKVFPEKSYFEKLKESRKRKRSKDVTIVLGVSTDNEDG